MQNPLSSASSLQQAYLLNPDVIANSVTKRSLDAVGIATREFLTPSELLGALPLATAGCLLLEFALPEMPGLRVMELLRQRGNYLPCIFISARLDPALVVTCMNRGAFGFIKKPLPQMELLDTVQRAIHHHRSIYPYIAMALEYREGREQLTRREKQVLELVEMGLSAREIGERLRISPRTAENTRQRLFTKLNLNSGAQLVRRVTALDLLRAMGVFR